MEKTYTVDWCERKTTSTGKEKLDASLKDETGAVTENVTLWGDFPGFKEIMPGSKVTGTLTPAKDPRFGPTLYPAKPKTGQGGAYKQKLMEEAVARKETSIKAFQATKEESIRLSSAQRDAVLIVTTLLNGIESRGNLGEAYIKGEIIKWRDWFLLSREFNDTPPFAE